MAHFSDENDAREAGFEITHQPEQQRFVLTGDGVELGEAHYSPLPGGGFDFDHTVVDPSQRGTGLSELLVRHALADEAVFGNPVQASCWYVDGLLKKHPELATLR